jgi:DNA helicase-2/ATP-dependent DNA helicase PcrA
MNLLVIAHLRSRGNHVSEPFASLLQEHGFPRTKDFDVASLPEAKIKAHDLPKTYSYTGDYLFYKRCARNYMVFGKYGFAPARTQTMFFGSLVHQTIEDLHQYLISKRASQ